MNANGVAAHVVLISRETDEMQGLCGWLHAQRDPPLQVTHINSLAEGLTMLPGSRAEALVIDLSTDGVEPVDTCRQLRGIAPHVPIVLVALPDQEAAAEQALQEGADEFVLKGLSDGRDIASAVGHAVRRARVEAELREEQERHRRLLDLLDDGVASLDAHGCFLRANRAMALMLGYDRPDDLEGLSLRDVYAGPQSADTVLDMMRSPSGLSRGEAELLCRSGERVTVIVRARRRGPADGQGICDLVCTNITAERRLEHEAREAEPLIAGGIVAAGVGVEVRRLMTAITGAHRLLLETIDKNHPRSQDLDYVRDTAAQAAALTDELLVAMRRRTMRPAVLDAGEVIKRSRPALQETFGDVLVRVPPQEYPSGQVSCIAGELDQVIVELATLARAEEPECRITVATAPVYLDATFAREHLALMPGHYVAFLVTTSGQSIDTLMAPDWEAERSFRRETSDRQTALQLAAIHRTVVQAGGHFTIRRVAGTGTTFKVYLPRVDSPGRRGTILLVEDEPSIRCGGRQLIELLDYRVLEAADPHEAIWLASRLDGEIDLLIADVILPGMTGREMADRLVAGGYVSQVLYMSGLLKETLVERETLPSNARFIEKPFTMAQLTAAIRDIFGDAPA